MTGSDRAIPSSLADVDRLEVIDHGSRGRGRILVMRPVAVSLSVQDDGRTLKVFVDDHRCGPAADRTPVRIARDDGVITLHSLGDPHQPPTAPALMWPATPAAALPSDLAEQLRTLRERPVPIQDGDGEITAVLVSRTFFDRAYEALEDVEDARLVAERMRLEDDDDDPGVPLEELLEEFGIDRAEFDSDSDAPRDSDRAP